MNMLHTRRTYLSSPVLLGIAGILLFLIGCGDAFRRQVIWNDTVATLGERISGNHMSMFSGSVVYLDENGGSHAFSAPLVWGHKRGEPVNVEFRRSDPAHGWLATSPPYRRLIPAALTFIGLEMILAALVLRVREGRIPSVPLTARKLNAIVISVSIVLAGVVIAWCNFGPGPIPKNRIAHNFDRQEKIEEAAAAAIRRRVRPQNPDETEDEMPFESVVTAQELDATWRTDLELIDVTAGEALEQLCVDCGLKFTRAGRNHHEYLQIQKALNQRVGVKLQGESRLVAIDDICRQIGLWPEFSIRQLGLIPDSVLQRLRFPSTSAGPFLVQILGIHMIPESGTGWVTLQFTAADIPEAASARLRNTVDPLFPSRHDPVHLQLAFATGPNGESVSDGRTKSRRTVKATTQTVVFRETFLLKNLTRTIDTIDLRGEFTFTLPTEIETLQFDQPQQDATVSHAGIDIHLRSWRMTPSSTSMVLEAHGVEAQRVTVTAFGPDGIIPGSRSGRRSTKNSGITFHDYFEQIPTSIEVRAITQVEPVPLQFELTDVPLPEFEKMPEKIAPFSFDGAAPVTFSRVSVVAAAGNVRSDKLDYTATNQANWAIIRGRIRLDFLDEADEFVVSHNTQFGSERNLVQPKQTSPFAMTLSILPKNVKSARVYLIDAEFVDGTVWSAPE